MNDSCLKTKSDKSSELAEDFSLSGSPYIPSEERNNGSAFDLQDEFENMTIKEISDEASKYVSEHPFKGQATRI